VEHLDVHHRVEDRPRTDARWEPGAQLEADRPAIVVDDEVKGAQCERVNRRRAPLAEVDLCVRKLRRSLRQAEPGEWGVTCRRRSRGGVGRASQARRGVPDVIVNNAGAGRWLFTEEIDAEEFAAMTAVPLTAAFLVTRAFIVDMFAPDRRGQLAGLASGVA
jgi:NAD(P)-dependent dehydrogenase (short-subunit alcohol dehydrogenase family)